MSAEERPTLGEVAQALWEAEHRASAEPLPSSAAWSRIAEAVRTEVEARQRAKGAAGRDVVIAEALALYRSGYDGPFMGEAVEPLFRALALLEQRGTPLPAPAAHPVEVEVESLRVVARDAYRASKHMLGSADPDGNPVWADIALAVRDHVLAGLRERAGGPLTMTVEEDTELHASAASGLVANAFWHDEQGILSAAVRELDGTRFALSAARQTIADARYLVEQDMADSAAMAATLAGNGLEPGIAEEYRSDLDRAKAERDGLRAELEAAREELSGAYLGTDSVRAERDAAVRERDEANAHNNETCAKWAEANKRCETLEAALRGVLAVAPHGATLLLRAARATCWSAEERADMDSYGLTLRDASDRARAALTTARSETGKTGEGGDQ